MYTHYKSLSGKMLNQKQLNKFLEAADVEELCKMVFKGISTSEVIKILDDILEGLAGLHNCQDKRYILVKSVFEELRKSNSTNKHVNSIIRRIVVDFSIYSKIHLLKFVDYFIERIRNNDDHFMSWKDVLPLLMEKLEEEKSISYRGSDISGQEYKIAMIYSICDINWDTEILISVAKMFVELNVNIKKKEVYELIMKALTSKLMNVDILEIPPLVHQLLKLGSEYNSFLLFSTLSKYFAQNYLSILEITNCQDSIVPSTVTLRELQELESTVLYYIYQYALDNTGGPMEYMCCLKSVVNAPEYILDTFVISLLLLWSGLYEDQAFQILKIAFLRQIADEENYNSCAWLKRISNKEIYIFKIINQVIENSNKDRQLVLKGMVDFAFVLLSTERKVGTENHRPWYYGCKILQRIAWKRHDAGGTILEKLVFKIVCTDSNITQYIDCLAYMCRKLVMTVLDHQVWITTLLEHFLLIPGSQAVHVLRALLPLMQISAPIRDNLIMILRKALYRKGTQTRQMAVLGFLQLLKNIKLSNLSALSQSDPLLSLNVGSKSSIFTQASLENSFQKASVRSWHTTSLCREILSILNKCFSHEIEIRTHLYQEIYYCILENEELTEYLLEMLLEHFFEYYVKDEEVSLPLIFDKCSSIEGVEVILHEPLAELIFSLQKIYQKVASKDSPTIDSLAVVLESLCKRMALVDLEDLDLDEATDLLERSPQNEQKMINLKLVTSVYEALLAYKLGSWSPNSDNIGQNVIALFKGYYRFTDYLKKTGKLKRGKGNKHKGGLKDDSSIDTRIKLTAYAITNKLPRTIMDFDTISKTIILLYSSTNSWTTMEQISALRGRVEFHIYILQSCLQLLQNIQLLKYHELKTSLESNKKNIFSISRILFNHVVSDLNSVNLFNEQTASLGLECFKECCGIMCTLYSQELPSFLGTIYESANSESLTDQLQKVIIKLKTIFIDNLGEIEKEELEIQKFSRHLIEIISKLVQKTSFNGDKTENILDSLKTIAENKMDVQVTCLVLQLILSLEERSLEYGELVQDLCIECCAILGKTDKTNVASLRKFQMINETNIYPAYITINRTLALRLNNVNWLLNRLNSEYVVLTKFEVNNEYLEKRIKDKEQSLCRQFSFILGVFEILASVKIMPGQASETIFKNLQKVYNFACSLAKYFRKRSSSANPAFLSVRFIPVIQGASNALKQTVTKLILHIESSQRGGKSNNTFVQRNKILKEVMVIPAVVQAIDMFDKEIALLSKKTGVDLMKYTKYHTIRDFRIQNSELIENLEKMNINLVITQATHNHTQRINSTEESASQSDESLIKKRRTH